MNETKIMTLHPSGKQGVTILLRRYEVIKGFILSKLKELSEIPPPSSKCFRKQEKWHCWQPVKKPALPCLLMAGTHDAGQSFTQRADKPAFLLK